MPPGTETPEWVDREAVSAAYNYLKFANQDKPWWSWQYLAPDDPGRQFLASIPQPPDEMLWANEQQFSKTGVWGVGESAEYTPPEGQLPDPEQGGMTDDQWAGLPSWQKWAYRILSSPITAGAMGGIPGAAIGFTAGGPIGAVVGGVAGAGAGVYSQANPESSLAKMLMYLDYPREWLEQTLGLGVQAYGALKDPEKYGAIDEILNNIPAAWEAAHLTYTSAPLDVINWFTKDKEEAGAAWHLGTAEPIKIESGGDWVGVLSLARQRIMQGEKPDDVVNEVTGQYGFSGQFRELLSGFLLDPLNVLPFVESKAGASLAKMVGNPRLALAFETTHGVIEATRKYGVLLRQAPIAEVSELSAFSKWLGGLTPGGDVRYLQQPYQKGGVFGYMLGMTPAARSGEVVNNAGLNLAVLAEQAGDDPAQMVRYYRAAANTPDSLAREIGLQSLNSTDAAAIPMALKDFADVPESMLDVWNGGTWQRNVLENIAATTGQDTASILKALAEGDAEVMLRQFIDKAKGVDSDEAKWLVDAYNKQELNAGTFGDMVKSYVQDGLPYTAEQFRGQLFAATMEHMAQWSAKWFGVKPDPKWIRLTNVVKSAQSLVLLGLNPTYLANNFLNNVVTMAFDGVLGMRTAKAIEQIWSRVGVQPSRLRAGIGPVALGTEINYSALRKAATVEGLLSDMQRFFSEKTRKIQVFSNLSAKAEQWSSAQAYTSGFLQSWRQLWKPGRGYDTMPDPLHQRLAAIHPSLPGLIDGAIRNGLNRKEIETSLWTGMVKRNAAQSIDAIANVTGRSADEVQEALSHAGILEPAFAEKLSTAKTTDEILRLLSNKEQQFQNYLDKLAGSGLRDEVSQAAARTSREGAQAALEIFDRMSYDDAREWFDHFIHMHDTFEKARNMEKAQSNAYIRQQMAIARQRWQRINTRRQSQYLGITEGIGLDNATGQKFAGFLTENTNNWKEFYAYRDEVYKKFFNTIFESQERRTTEWYSIQLDLAKKYHENSGVEMSITRKMDAEITGMIKAKFGDQAAKVADEWRKGLRDIRETMVQEMEAFRDSIKDLPTFERDYMWAEFLKKDYFLRIREQFQANVEGARKLWDATGGAGVEDATPPNTKPPAPRRILIERGPWADAERTGTVAGEAQNGLVPVKFDEDNAIHWLAEDDIADSSIPEPERKAEMQLSPTETLIKRDREIGSRGNNIRQLAQRYGIPTADRDGNPLPGADTHILHAINKFGGEGFDRYVDLSQIDIKVAERALAARDLSRRQQMVFEMPEIKAGEITPEVAAHNAEVDNLINSQLAKATQEKPVEPLIEATPSLIEQVQKHLDAGDQDLAYITAFGAYTPEDIEAVKALLPTKELQDTFTEGKRIENALLDGRFNELPKEINELAGIATWEMQLGLTDATPGRKVFIDGKFDHSEDSTYPKWYGDVVGGYKKIPANKDAVLEAIKDIAVGNNITKPGGETYAVAARILDKIYGEVSESLIYQRAVGLPVTDYSIRWQMTKWWHDADFMTSDVLSRNLFLAKKLMAEAGDNLQLKSNIQDAIDKMSGRLASMADTTTDDQGLGAMVQGEISKAEWEDGITKYEATQEEKQFLKLLDDLQETVADESLSLEDRVDIARQVLESVGDPAERAMLSGGIYNTNQSVYDALPTDILYQQRPKQLGMFAAGEELPLFTGAAQRAEESVFTPREAEVQPGLPGMEAPRAQMKPALIDTSFGLMRRQVKDGLMREFLANQVEVLTGAWKAEEQVDAVMRLLDARASVWAKANGKTVEAWYQAHFAGFGVGEPRDAYYQQPTGPTWYSPLERTVEGIPMEKLTVEQLQGLIRKGGVKADELKWTGLDDWLSERAGQKVTKREAQDYLAANKVEVEEVVRGDRPDITQMRQRINELSPLGNNRTPEQEQELNRLVAYVNNQQKYDKATRYSSHNLPGGENYRELLLTLPIQRTPGGGYDIWTEGRHLAGPFETRELAMAEADRRGLDWRTEYNIAQRGNHPLEEGYESPHWEEPNVLAHVRFDERIDADGKRVLFIEEIQSDWHQAGREKGYREPALITDAEIDEIHEIRNRYGLSNDVDGSKLSSLPDDIQSRYRGLLWRYTQTEGTKNLPPPAPFAKTWHELSMKRMIRWAAENDFERIAFPTGEVAASIEGHQLIKDVKELQWRDNTIEYATSDTGAWHTVEIESGKKLEDYIGYDAAQQLRSTEPASDGWRNLKTKDIVFGGEKMRWFYDRNLVNDVNKYVKKWGSKVGETRIGTDGGRAYRLEDSNGRYITFSTRKAVDEALRNYNDAFPDEGWHIQVPFGETVHSIDVTPAMKESALQGQPMFQEAKGAVQFLEDGKAILYAMQAPDISTVVHEIGHIFRRDMLEADRLIAERWAGVVDGIWTRQAEEKFARGFERYLMDGVAPTPSLEGVFKKLANWLAHIYANVKEMLTGKLSQEMKGVYDRLLVESDAMDYPIYTEAGRAKVTPGEQATLFQLEDGQQGTLPPADTRGVEAVSLPLGAIEGENPAAPLGKMQEEGWSYWQPIFSQLKEWLMRPENAVPDEVMNLKGLDDATSRDLRRYLGGVYGKMGDTKLASIRIAENRRDMALLNYNQRYGFDNVATAIMPYQFWYGRSAINWAARAIDRPGWMANYARLREFQRKAVQTPGFPTRLRNKMKIPMPFLPTWAGDGVYVDPLRQLFPIETLARPFEQLSQQKNQEGKRAEYILQEWLEEGSEDQDGVMEALQTRQGALYDKAMAQARMEIEGDIQSPLDFAFLVSSPSLPLNWAYQAMTGRKDKIGPLPLTRLIRSSTALMGANEGKGINIESGIRKALGLPEYDWLEDYRIDRMLANMTAEGLVDSTEAVQAMIDRSGPAYSEASARVAKSSALGTFFGFTGADLFPEGEQEQRQLKLEYDKVVDAYQAGDKDAYTKFYDKYPEYEARAAQMREPEKRMRQFLIGRVWDAYMNLPALHQREIGEQLGGIFQQNFLDSETRSYDTIDTETLVMWIRAMGLQAPSSAPGAEGAMPPMNISSPEIAAAYQAYLEERAAQFPDISRVQSLLYSIPEGAVREQYKSQHPELSEYQVWRNQYLAAHPEIIPYTVSEDNKIANARPEIQAAYYQFMSQREQYFPGVLDKQNTYYDLPSGGRAGYRNSNPDLVQYWEWRRAFMAQYPEMIPYLMSTDSLAQAVLGEDYIPQAEQADYGMYQDNTPKEELTAAELNEMTPALVRQLYGYYLCNQKLSSGAMQELNRIHKISGRSVTFEEYINQTVRNLFISTQ